MLLLVLMPARRMILVLLASTICMASLPPMETVPHLPWGSVDAVERVQAGLPVVLTETGFVSGPVSTEWTESYLATHWDKGASRPCHGLQTTLRTAAGRPLFYYTDRHERATYNLGRVRYATCVIDPRNGRTHTHTHTHVRTHTHTHIALLQTYTHVHTLSRVLHCSRFNYACICVISQPSRHLIRGTPNPSVFMPESPTFFQFMYASTSFNACSEAHMSPGSGKPCMCLCVPPCLVENR